MDQVSEHSESTLAARALRVAFVPAIAVSLMDILLRRPLLHFAGAANWTGTVAAVADLLEPVVLATRCVLVVVVALALAATRVPKERNHGRTALFFACAAVLAAIQPLYAEAALGARIVVCLGAILLAITTPQLRFLAAAVAAAAAGDIASTMLPHGEAASWATDALLIASFVLAGAGFGRWQGVRAALLALLVLALLLVFPGLAGNAARIVPLAFENVPPSAGLAVCAWATMLALEAPRRAARIIPAALMLLSLAGTEPVDLATAGLALLLHLPRVWPVQSRGGVDSPPASPLAPGSSPSPL